jgi:hypothetical protein
LRHFSNSSQSDQTRKNPNGPSASLKEHPAAAGCLRQLAADVQRIGDGWSQDPETVAIQKDDVAKRLVNLAQELEHE